MKIIFTLAPIAFLLSAGTTSAQIVSASPQNIVRPVGPNTVSVFLNRLSGGWNSPGNYTWSVTPSTGVTIGTYSQSGTAAGDVTVTFAGAATGAYTFTLTRGSASASVTVNVGNVAASTSSGTFVSVFNVNNGTWQSGPGNVFELLVPSSAIGLSAAGYYYYLPSAYDGNDGNVTVYAANPDGSGSTAIGSIDLNGASNNDLGFVRLAIDPVGAGWILAGDNATLYLGKFVTNGRNPVEITVVDPSVTLVNGSVANFFNGDICFTGNGTLYALGNSASGGVTQIFSGAPNGAATVLTKKWDLVNEDAEPFAVSVNGVAFDFLGSLYISTANGLYYIDQHTANTATGTVQCTLVTAVTGLTDLATNVYPEKSTLPVQLISFSAAYLDQKATLNWKTAGEVNFSYFEIERSSEGGSFSKVAVHMAEGSANGNFNYRYVDDLTAVSGSSFTYRLKMVDHDGGYTYSRTVLLRKEAMTGGITINPNPVLNGVATLRLRAASDRVAEFRVMDISGRLLLIQRSAVMEGVNSISLNGIDRLLPGTYILQWLDAGERQSVKFTIAR